MIIDNILDNYNLPKDIYENINSFLFWDKNSLKYAKFRNEQENIKKINSQIKSSLSRKKGFDGSQNEDTDIEHWAFGNDDFQLQAINCFSCGNYIATYNSIAPNYIICSCGIFY